MFASEIYDKNQIAAQEGRPIINLQSVLIGNGITDVSTSVLFHIINTVLGLIPLTEACTKAAMK